MTENEYQLRIEQLECEVADLKTKLTAKQKTTRYGLVWEDVPEAFEKEAENKIPILEEVKDKAIKNDDGKPTHILIEGDNYHALQCLNYTHRGKVDVIYIDPPYNTGSDGFTYKDKRFLDQFPNGTTIPKEHPLRHSTWLSFMEKRLKLAKNLLKDDGVIFISINEDELANLKLLCEDNSIFSAENYVTLFTIKVRHEDRILKGDKPIHETTEFLLMYQKSDAFKIQKRIKDTSSPKEYKYQIKEINCNPEVEEIGGKMVQIFNPGEYEILEKEESFDNLKKINIRGSIKTGNSSGRFHMNYLEERNNKFNVLYKVPDIGDDGLGYRYFLSRKNEKQANGSYFQGAPLGREDTSEIPYPNFFDFELEFNNVGTEGGVPFDGGKKPISFIKHILKIAKDTKSKNRDYVILDFFAGSGSTMHAIADMSNFQCISIQSPELTYEIKDGKKIPRAKNVFAAGFERIVDVTYQRHKNVISGYTNAKGEQVAGLGNSLKYYRTAFVGNHDAATATDEDKVVLAHKAGTLIAIAENTLEEIETTDTYQIFNDGNRYTAIYFTGDLSGMSDFVEKVESIRNNSRLINISVYIYCLGNVHVFDNEFGSLKRIKLKGIPQPIIEIYKQLNA